MSEVAFSFDQRVLQSLPSEQHPRVTVRGNAIGRFFDRPIFIAGVGRSGTTLLLRLLDGHPDLFTVPSDSLVLPYFLPAFRRTGDRQTLADSMAKRLELMIFRSPPELAAAQAHVRWAILHAEEITIRLLFRTLLQALVIKHVPDGKKYWLEKTPGNDMHLDAILEAFPKARIVYNVRDPRAVFHSIKKGRPTASPAHIAGKWAQRINAFLGFMSHSRHIRSHLYMLRYEQYVRDPEEVGRMLDFFKLRRPEKGLVPTHLGIPFRGNSFNRETDSPGRVDAEKVDAWQSALTAEEVGSIVRHARVEMRLLGYI